MILVQLLLVFFIIGLVSFGGGYAMVPLVQDFVVDRFGWMSPAEFTDTVALAGMAPGPIAANGATIVGYHQAGLPGAIAALTGIILPSFIIILLLAALFKKHGSNRLVQSAFYGLKPAITGLILYAAFIMALNNGLMAEWSVHTASQVLIFLGSLAALLFFRIHPVIVILVSGVIGMVIYS